MIIPDGRHSVGRQTVAVPVSVYLVVCEQFSQRTRVRSREQIKTPYGAEVGHLPLQRRFASSSGSGLFPFRCTGQEQGAAGGKAASERMCG